MGLATRIAVVLALALALAAPAGASAAVPADADAEASALKRCKKGLNKNRCKCPADKKRKKVGNKYRCVKKAPEQLPPEQIDGGGGTDTGGGTTDTGGGTTDTGGGTTDTGGGTGGGTTTQPPPQQPIRDDAGFSAAIANNFLRKYVQGGSGYGAYAYSFFSNGQFLYCSYYAINGSSVPDNRSGTWQLIEGYRDAADPNYYGGFVRLTLSGGSTLNIAVEVRGNEGYIALPQGTGSPWEGGSGFARNPGGKTAIANCSAIDS